MAFKKAIVFGGLEEVAGIRRDKMFFSSLFQRCFKDTNTWTYYVHIASN